MPAIDFPASPSVNDEYSFEGRTWRWNGTGWEVKEYPAALLAGTAANPSLYFSGDPNTGLYSPGADQVAISTGGTGRLFVDASGNVGIDTSSPSNTAGFVKQLELAGSIPCLTINQTNAGFTLAKYSIGANSVGGLGVWHNDTSLYRMYIDNAGNVGIGTSSPAELLELSATTDPKIRFVDVGNVEGKIGISSSTALTFEFAGSERARIDSSGRLLVGTSSSTADAIAVFLGRTSALGGTGGEIKLAHPTANVPANGTLGRIQFGNTSDARGAEIFAVADSTWATNDYPTYLVFATTADGAASPTERMRISSTGAVGIGTSSPGAALDVSGNIQISLNSVSYHQIKYDTNNLVISANTGAANQTANIIFESSGAGGSMVSEKARIDSSGRLLVGTSTARDNFFNTGGFGGRLQVEGANSNAQRVISNVYGASNTGGPILALAKHRSDSIGGTTVVISGDECGLVSFQASDGTEFVEAARIAAEVDGTPGANDMPGRLVFSTTADGAASPTEQLRITNGGTVVYNQPAPAAVNTTATLTVANLTAKIITSTTAAAVTMTLPTGTDMDAGFSGLYTNMAFEWSVINTGATNAVTVQGGTGHTVVGSGTVAASNSGCFVSRRTAATTWVTYRLSS